MWFQFVGWTSPAPDLGEVSLAKTILITGCSTGLGFAAARAFAERGYRVIATVRKAEDAKRLAAFGEGRIDTAICDVTNPGHVAALPDIVRRVSEDGNLDGL